MHNRCPHKGTRITTDTCGNTGKFFRCPYHAWTFRTDGSLFFIPLRKGYENTGLETSHASEGISPVRHVRNYRGFVFAKLNDTGSDFEEPPPPFDLAGGVLRYMHNCNWKMLVGERDNRHTHPMVAHKSSAGTAIEVWKKAPPGAKKPMAVEIYAPFMAPYEFFENMGIRVWPNGHGHTGVHHSIHSDYSAVPGYSNEWSGRMEKNVRRPSWTNRHNTIISPT